MSQQQDAADSLYRKDPKVYPRDVNGKFASLRKLAVLALLGLYYFMPWINWSGRQAILFDLPARKFYILGLTFWPQDFIFLTLMLSSPAYPCFLSRQLPEDCGVVMPVRRLSGQKCFCGLRDG